MPKLPINMALGAGAAENPQGASGSLMNLYAQSTPTGARHPVSLLNTPGTRLFASLDDTLVLGMITFRNVLYVATRRGFWRVFAGGRAERIADVVFSGPVSMAENSIVIFMVDGARGYVFEPEQPREVNGPFTFRQVAGDGFEPAESVVFFDGYFVFVQSNSGIGRFFFSSLFSTEIAALDFATAEFATDKLVTVATVREQLWFFGERTIEPWFNQGGGPIFNLPFARIDGAVIEHGIAAPRAKAVADNTVVWLANNGIVYAARGFQPERISTHEVEHSLALQSLSTAEAFVYYHDGHTFVVLTAGDVTWVFDFVTGLWHRRSFYDSALGFDNSPGRHHASGYARAYGRHLIGDAFNGRVLEWDDCEYTDVGRPLVSEIVLAPMHATRNRALFHEIEFLMDFDCLSRVQPVSQPKEAELTSVFILDVTSFETCGPG